MADIPREAVWYAARSTPFWMVFSIVLLVGHFAIPLLLLLVRAVKRRALPMIVIGGWLLLMHYLDLYWIVMPARWTSGFGLIWLDLAMVAALAGLACVFALWRHARFPVTTRESATADSPVIFVADHV